MHKTFPFLYYSTIKLLVKIFFYITSLFLLIFAKQHIMLNAMFVKNFYYCKKSFLNKSTQTTSIQPKIIPKGIVKILITKRTSPPFLKKVDHLTTISTISLTTGISNNKTCTNLLCLLNHVIFISSYFALTAIFLYSVKHML